MNNDNGHGELAGSPSGTRNYQTIPRPRRASLFGPHGGINSVEHFASSFTRAQSFLTVEPWASVSRHRSYFTEHGTPTTVDGWSHHDDASFVGDEEEAIDDDSAFADDSSHHGIAHQLLLPKSSFHDRRLSEYTTEPADEAMLVEEAEAVLLGTETNPVIVRKTEDAVGHVVQEVVGQSTVPQTIFNSINVLIGVGMLALPLGFYEAGWLAGTFMLALCAATTYYTARLLAKCASTDSTVVTYADIAYCAFQTKGRALVGALFTAELVMACVSLLVLFADSLNALFPVLSPSQWKVVAFVIITPLGFLPLRVLSISSILGILCTFGLLLSLVFGGLYKQHAPGSLWEPAHTWLLPRHGWDSIGRTIGIFMAPWGGHAVFPNIYRDMRHPAKYVKAVNVVYQVTFLVDLSMGALGFAMFGAGVLDEITKNVVVQKGYPRFLTYCVVLLSALIPLAKTPLNARPIVHTIDTICGVNDIAPHYGPSSSPTWVKKGLHVWNRIAVILVMVVLAVLFPEFDRVLGILGAFLGTLVCLILPIAFYLRIFHGKISSLELVALYTLLVCSCAVAVVGTIYSIS